MSAANAATNIDPYFPASGNSGYDALSYSLFLRYDPAPRALDATAIISLKAATDLSSLSFDLRDLSVTGASVNGRTARVAQADGKLVLTPSRPLTAGRLAVVRIAYSGSTGNPLDNTGVPYGWWSTDDGALVASEPDGAATWYPVNDALTDKARYTFSITVPAGKTAVANGLPVGSPTTRNGWTTSRWVETSPMASYLAMVNIGDYDVTTTHTSSGLPIITAVDRDITGDIRATTDAALARQAEIIEYYESLVGPYPFSSAGAVVDDDDIGYALETQSRSLYSVGADESTVAHETAHQWYGDSVTPRQWSDIWLNEGFATYAEWLWTEHAGGSTVAEQAADVASIPADDGFWTVSVTDPGATGLFDAPIYNRGALTLAQLRSRIGDATFQRLLTRWASSYRHRNASTEDFEALAEQLSGQDLDEFFSAYLVAPEKPADL